MATTVLSRHHPYLHFGLYPRPENLPPREGAVILKGTTLHPLSQTTLLKISHYLLSSMITQAAFS